MTSIIVFHELEPKNYFTSSMGPSGTTEDIKFKLSPSRVPTISFSVPIPVPSSFLSILSPRPCPHFFNFVSPALSPSLSSSPDFQISCPRPRTVIPVLHAHLFLKSRLFGSGPGRLGAKFIRAGPTWTENSSGPGRAFQTVYNFVSFFHQTKRANGNGLLDGRPCSLFRFAKIRKTSHFDIYAYIVIISKFDLHENYLKY